MVFWICIKCVSAQSSGLDYQCITINERVVVPQNPVKVQRKKHISACVFELVLEKDKSVEFRIERHRSRKDASFELESLRQQWISEATKEHPLDIKYRKNFDPAGFWDEAVYSDDSYSERFILLRQNKYFILITGNDSSVVKRTEQLLRNIRFN